MSAFVAVAFGIAGCSSDGRAPPRTFSLGPDANGAIETVDNIVNTTVVSNDPNPNRAEYVAGFIQGKLQKDLILVARDNDWDSLWITDPGHSFPKTLPPTTNELAMAQQILTQNYAYTIQWIRAHPDRDVAAKLTRLLFRLVGIHHGTRLAAPASLDFSGTWLPDLSWFAAEERALGYETPALTFLDLYFVNAFADVMDVIGFRLGAPLIRMPKCSAFVKKIPGDVVIAHNTWASFLSQTQSMNLSVNGTFVTWNLYTSGLLGSETDFGYNGAGILFNETTHHATRSTAREDRLWMFWRSALAEQFATSIDEFFRYVSLEASGTYMNGYMVVDAKTKDIGLVEMSDANFVFFRPDAAGGPIVTTKPEGLSIAYDADLLRTDAIFGVNYPVSHQIRDDLLAIDTRPARRRQFAEKIGAVVDVESAKALITYTDPANPLSIFGRWDLGRGETDHPKTVPAGSIDAKVAMASMTADATRLTGTFDLGSPVRSYWMKYGTPSVDGAPFIWSRSQWPGQKLRGRPDRVDGNFQLLNTYVR